MDNNKVIVIENTANAIVSLTVPNTNVSRTWSQRGAKATLPFGDLEQAYYTQGGGYLFNNGILYIEDLEAKIALGLEEAKEDGDVEDKSNLKIKKYVDADFDELMNGASMKAFKEELEKMSPEQRRTFADYAIEHEISNYNKAKVIKELVGVDVIAIIEENNAEAPSAE